MARIYDVDLINIQLDFGGGDTLLLESYGGDAKLRVEYNNQKATVSDSLTRGMGTTNHLPFRSGVATVPILANSAEILKIRQKINEYENNGLEHFQVTVTDRNTDAVSISFYDCSFRDIPKSDKEREVTVIDVAMNFHDEK